MKTKRRTVLIVAILTVILSVTAILAIGLRRAPEKALLKIMSDRVDLQVKNVHYTEVGNSGMKWEITADTARYQKKENLALFEKVKVRLMMKDGRVFVMNGDRGRLNTQSRDVEIEGNVGIVSENGDRISTDRLLYRDAGKTNRNGPARDYGKQECPDQRRGNDLDPGRKKGHAPVAGTGEFHRKMRGKKGCWKGFCGSLLP